VGSNSTDRGKNGRKHSLLVDARGIPLSPVASGANRHDSYLLGATLGAVVCPRPDPASGQIETFCGDAAYVGFPALATSRVHNYQLNVKTRQELEEKRNDPDKQAHCRVVERTHSWFSRFRKLLVSFETTEASYKALLSPAATLILLETNYSYLRISSKYIGGVVPRIVFPRACGEILSLAPADIAAL
jgi:putative transposase